MREIKDEHKDATTMNADQNEPNRQNEPEINWKQVMGCLSATSLSFAGGLSLAYTSSLFPALQAPDSDIPTSDEQNAWLASSGSLSAPLGAILGGFLMERIGRLTTLYLSVLPFCISWIVTATAHNYVALLTARIIIGAVFIMGISPAGVLITETAVKTHRGALSSVGQCFTALGVLVAYVLGAILDWRTFAWVSVLSPLIPFILAWIFTAESPLWLRVRGRTKAAQKASLYYYNDPNYVVQAIVPRRTTIQTNGEAAKTAQKQDSNAPRFSEQLCMLLTRPSGLKPLIILTLTFLLQTLTGVYVILVNAVPFFQEAGSTVDPYIASIIIGVVKFIASFITIFLLRHCHRRFLMLVGTAVMAFCLGGSAYATSLALLERDGGPKSPLPPWVVVACIVIHQFAANISIQTVPWTMSAELFPQQVRGAAQSFNFVSWNIFMFGTIQAYPWMNQHMGGSVGVQYFFAAMSFLSAIVTWIFFPETHGKSLTEIEEYFVHNTIYLGHKQSPAVRAPRDRGL